MFVYLDQIQLVFSPSVGPIYVITGIVKYVGYKGSYEVGGKVKGGDPCTGGI